MANLKSINRDELLKQLVEEKEKSLAAINRAFVEAVANVDTLVSAGKEVEVSGLEDLCTRAKIATVSDIEVQGHGELDVRFEGSYVGSRLSDRHQLPEGSFRVFVFVVPRP